MIVTQPPVAPGSDRSRYWLYGGIALLLVAVAYSGVLLVRARAREAADRAAVDAAAAKAPPVRFVPAEDAVLGEGLGRADAPVVVREFADFQCPACGAFEHTLERMRHDYVDTGRVRFVFFDYPLDQHKNALLAAEAARCAGAQGRYWPMHDLLYARQQQWADLSDPLSRFGSYGAEVGADASRLLTCLRSGAMRAIVMRSQAYGDTLGVDATPSYGVNAAGRAGPLSYADLKKLIATQYALTRVAAAGTH